MSKKEKPYLLTQKLAAEIVARKKIRPDAPNTMPGDPGNGHVLLLDDEHQKFGGHVYTRLEHSKNHNVKYFYTAERIHYIHVDVWTFHNGKPPAKQTVHHEHRKPDGNFDQDENSI